MDICPRGVMASHYKLRFYYTVCNTTFSEASVNVQNYVDYFFEKKKMPILKFQEILFKGRLILRY